MPNAPAGVPRGPLTIAARSVLLDALTALRPLGVRDALIGVVLAGGQAVQLRTETGSSLPAVFTIDGDLSLDPRTLAADPLLEAAMHGGGFTETDQPGIWSTSREVAGHDVSLTVDLLVPAGLAAGNRAARIPPHHKRAARLVAGLEASLVDHDPMVIRSLDPRDDRQCPVLVAGVAALLLAKAHKIADRLADPKPGREADKDAGDVIRLMAVNPPGQIAGRMAAVLADAVSAESAVHGLELLGRLFGGRSTNGTTMAAAALAGSEIPEATVRVLAPSYLAALRAHMAERR